MCVKTGRHGTVYLYEEVSRQEKVNVYACVEDTYSRGKVSVIIKIEHVTDMQQPSKL